MRTKFAMRPNFLTYGICPTQRVKWFCKKWQFIDNFTVSHMQRNKGMPLK